MKKQNFIFFHLLFRILCYYWGDNEWQSLTDVSHFYSIKILYKGTELRFSFKKNRNNFRMGGNIDYNPYYLNIHMVGESLYLLELYLTILWLKQVIKNK